jgi:hypothetical protein
MARSQYCQALSLGFNKHGRRSAFAIAIARRSAGLDQDMSRREEPGQSVVDDEAVALNGLPKT